MYRVLQMPNAPCARRSLLTPRLEELSPEERAIIACFAREKEPDQPLPMLSVGHLRVLSGLPEYTLLTGIEELERREWLFRSVGPYPGDDASCVLLHEGAQLARAEAQRLHKAANREQADRESNGTI
jgi:hypothetical protein